MQPVPSNLLEFQRAKSAARRLSMVTCYDYSFARLVSRSTIDAILVGDSAAMVMHGYETTLSATPEMMQMHTAAVAKGARNKLIVTDMPFLTYRKGMRTAMDTAHALMTAGAHALKLEGVAGHEEVIERLVESGIPVMGHLGLQPQSVHAYGGYRVQGRGEGAAAEILQQAEVLQDLGAFSLVLECVPAALAEQVSRTLRIPVIGIGAGAGCDGQVLVLQDMLGMNSEFRPRFARVFTEAEKTVIDAINDYDAAVKDASFPTAEESFR